ncbi:MAG: amino acid adenylation domain-containing protein, partial [bacterium]|nr:amino acid adenylation domain-containing protein [bacterium]
LEVKERTIQAYDNQEYQFEDLVDKISIPMDTGRNPLFDILFNLLNITIHGGEIDPRRDNADFAHKETASKFDMTLAASENHGIILFNLSYAITLFKEKTIDRIIGYFKKIIKTVITNPDKKIATIDIISGTIKNEILTRFNRNLEDETVKYPLQNKFARSFEKYSHRIAIRYAGTELSYSEVERKAASISTWILRHQIPKGSFIGIFIENRLESIIVILGILNAGCAFVPLNTSLPAGRLKLMIRDINTPVIFTDEANEKKISHMGGHYTRGNGVRDTGSDKKTTRFHTPVINSAFYRENNPQAAKLEPLTYEMEAAIYVFFTSGTTGTPKGIIGKNSGLTQFIQWEVENFDVTPSYYFSQFINVGFDPYLRDVFTPLFAGAAICIPQNNQIILERDILVEWIEKNRISFIHCVPTVFSLFNSPHLTPQNYKSLKYVSVAGEALNPHELKNWYASFGERIGIINKYGPSETTLAKMFDMIEKADMHNVRLAVGSPMRGASVIILDKGKNVCDRGQLGEIHIRSPYMTHGYCNDPELTGRRFPSNPFSEDPLDRVYRTGDLGREREDGKIELLGRIDRQIKIRGMRIELADIENALLKRPEIKKNVVLVNQYQDGEKYLCAYILQETEFQQDQLKQYLLEILPAYMVPAFFIKI